MPERLSWKAIVLVLPISLYTLVLSAVFFTPVHAQTNERTVLDGVFSASQAEEGHLVFAKYCADCHGADLSGAGAGGNGNAPALKGARFLTDYEADNLARPFNHMKMAMPQNAPGTLKDAEYVAVLAYILQENAYPAGNEALAVDPAVLRRTRIVRKGGPTEAPNFSLVRLVGCLDGAADNWSVIKASMPVVTKDSAVSTGDDLVDAAARPLGDGTFKLLNAVDPLDSKKGQKMEVKGLLIRQPAGNRINVVSVQAVAQTCGN